MKSLGFTFVNEVLKLNLQGALRTRPRTQGRLNMFVLTIDQVKSRDNDDRVPHMLHLLADIPTLAPFERTVGDEIQGVPRDAAAALEAIRRCIRDGHWHCGLGIGSGDFASQEAPRSAEGGGFAFYAARQAIEASKNLSPSLAVRIPAHSDYEAEIGALLALKMHVAAQRTHRQWQVIDALNEAQSRTGAARVLGITPSAVSQSLHASAWETESGTDNLLIRLLEQADSVEDA